MASPPVESPADEYERRLTERRATIRQALVGVLSISAWLHLFGLVVTAMAVLGREQDLRILALLLWAAAILLAALSAFVCFRNVPYLNGRLILLGAAPWLALLAESSTFVALAAIGVLRF